MTQGNEITISVKHIHAYDAIAATGSTWAFPNPMPAACCTSWNSILAYACSTATRTGFRPPEKACSSAPKSGRSPTA